MTSPARFLPLLLALQLARGAQALTAVARAAEEFIHRGRETAADPLQDLSDLAGPYTGTWSGLQDIADSARVLTWPSRVRRSAHVSLLQTFEGDKFLKQESQSDPHLARGMQQPRVKIAERTPLQKFLDGCSFIVMATLVALVWKYTRPEVAPGLLESLREDAKFPDEFEYRLFDTRKCDAELFFCAGCCLCIRWAATVSDVQFGLVTFWPAFFLFVCLEGFHVFLVNVGIVIWLAMMIYFRQKMRAHYGITHGTLTTYVEDCLVWWCCPCFAGAQEAKQLENVKGPGPPGQIAGVPETNQMT